MRSWPMAVMTGAVVALLAGSVAAQSLGDAARKERERRKHEKSGKVYTEGDLQKAGGTGAAGNYGSGEAPAASPSPDASAAPAGAAKAKEKTPDEQRAEAEKAWHDKLQKAQAEVARLNAEVQRLQQALGDLTQNLYGASRTAQLNELDADKAKLAAAQQAVADLEEEGRRNSYR